MEQPARSAIIAVMSLFDKKPRWYAAGLAFECVGCGGCCSGPEEGYVWVSDEEVEAIAQTLGLASAQMRRRYVRRVGRRQSLVERRDNHDCIFLKPDGQGGKTCAIYDVRPVQCRTWPFWPMNLANPSAWAKAGQRCQGINRGRPFTLDEIENLRDATKV